MPDYPQPSVKSNFLINTFIFIGVIVSLSAGIIVGSIIYKPYLTRLFSKDTARQNLESKGKLPIDLGNPAIKAALLNYRLETKVFGVRTSPQSSSSSVIVSSSQDPSAQETIEIPWDRTVNYSPSLNIKHRIAKVTDIKAGMTVSLLISQDLSSGKKTIGQVLIINP